MTTNYQMKKPCEASDDCLHVVCKVCGVLVRSNSRSLEDHGGTVIGVSSIRLCARHRNQGTSNTLTEAELAWMRTEYPHAYRFHRVRRDREIPPEGKKFIKETNETENPTTRPESDPANTGAPN